MDSKLRIPNYTDTALKGQHFSQVRKVYVPSPEQTSDLPPAPASRPAAAFTGAANIDPDRILPYAMN